MYYYSTKKNLEANPQLPSKWFYSSLTYLELFLGSVKYICRDSENLRQSEVGCVNI